MPTGKNIEHARPPNLDNKIAQKISLSSAPSAAPSANTFDASPAREQSLVQLGVSDADHSPMLPDSVREGEEESAKLTKELSRNLETLDAFQDKLTNEEKSLGAFFKQQVRAADSSGPARRA